MVNFTKEEKQVLNLALASFSTKEITNIIDYNKTLKIGKLDKTELLKLLESESSKFNKLKDKLNEL